ncbi:unnamed protein product [Lymnaea stagnalis]|uniref:Uncharacterized protein n=1 Tax=Lymnaea stagnalis TaxID=6523 RepID=A0AAV2I8T4_LYMST
MSQKGPCLTEQKKSMYEIRADAAIILEEFLKKHIAENDFRNSAVTGRNKSDPLSERTKVYVGHKRNGVPRSKTMPSKTDSQEKNAENHSNNNGMPRSKTIPFENDPSKVNDLKRKDSDSSSDKNVRIHGKSMENGFESSADSDGDPEEVLSNRKKKSAFKKAKQRLRHWFHLSTRDKKDGLMTGSEQNTPTVTKKIKKKYSLDDHGHTHRADSKYSTLDTVNIHAQGQADKDSQKNGRKSSFFGSIRKTQKIKAAVASESKPEITRVELEKPRSSLVSFPAIAGAVAQGLINLPTDNNHHLPAPPPPPPGQASPTDNNHHLPAPPPPPPGQASSVSKSSSPSPLNIGSVQAANSTSSSNFPASDYTKDGSNTNILSSVKSNALDSPGEDIDYIDLDDLASQTSSSKVDVRSGSSPKMFKKFLGSSGLLKLKLLAESIGRENEEQEEMVDGISSSKMTSQAATDFLDELGHDALDGQNSAKAQHQSDKDELYGKIAKKLAEMADSYSATMSDPESRSVAAVLAAPPSELEKDIIDCLRSIGDRNSAVVDENFEAARAEATEEAYHRFKSTIQNSMGSELSWNHLAFVFFTTKGVISAVGKGTKAAAKAKEFTLDYISDNFASWIMDQGGFDSIMVSSSDSDFELD